MKDAAEINKVRQRWVWRGNGCEMLARGVLWLESSVYEENGQAVCVGVRPQFSSSIVAAWKLFESARNGEHFWDFVQAMETLCDDPDMATRDAPLRVIHVLGHLTPGLVTRAFVLAMSS
jgi:hypothetical protein